MTTNNNGGVRFAFDDEQNNTDTINNYLNLNASSSATTTTLTNPASTSKKSEKSSDKASKKAETYNLTVTIPISAASIEPATSSAAAILKPAVQANEKVTTDLTLIENPVPNNSANPNTQTPVLVTITMASKCSPADTDVKGPKTKTPGAKKNGKSSAYNSGRKSSKKVSTNTPMGSLAGASSHKLKILNANSASVACGSVEMNVNHGNAGSRSNVGGKNTVKTKADIKFLDSGELLAGTAISTMKRLNVLIDGQNNQEEYVIDDGEEMDTNVNVRSTKMVSFLGRF